MKSKCECGCYLFICDVFDYGTASLKRRIDLGPSPAVYCKDCGHVYRIVNHGLVSTKEQYILESIGEINTEVKRVWQLPATPIDHIVTNPNLLETLLS